MPAPYFHFLLVDPLSELDGLNPDAGGMVEARGDLAAALCPRLTSCCRRGLGVSEAASVGDPQVALGHGAGPRQVPPHFGVPPATRHGSTLTFY